MHRQFLVLATGAALAALPVQTSTAQTDIIRKPSEWRGTLLEGTDGLIATDDYGYPVFIQTDETIGSVFQPSAMTGDRLAAEFKKLCLDTQFDAAKLASAAATSTLGLANRSIDISALRSGPNYRANVWASPEARVQIWSGDTTALTRRQTLSRWRNGATSSFFRPSDTAPLSCGLTVMSTGLHSPAGFISAMTALLAAEPAKAVTKEAWADGHWTLPAIAGGKTRITYSMTDLNREEQLLHVAITRGGD